MVFSLTGGRSIVHRIDKDTSGLMVAAKTDRTHEGLAKQFAAHSIDRRYRAITGGIPRPADGTVDARQAGEELGAGRLAPLQRGPGWMDGWMDRGRAVSDELAFFWFFGRPGCGIWVRRARAGFVRGRT